MATKCYCNPLAFMFHNSCHQIPHQLVNITLLSTATMCKSYNMPAATTVSNNDATYNQLVNFDLHGESKLIVYCILGILLIFLARKCQKVISHCHRRKLKKQSKRISLHMHSIQTTNFLPTFNCDHP